jgi:hypothetical protein
MTRGRVALWTDLSGNLEEALRLLFLITNGQVQALEKHRNGDLRLELQVNAVLPQAASGFPGATQVSEYITIAESRWRQQLAGAARATARPSGINESLRNHRAVCADGMLRADTWTGERWRLNRGCRARSISRLSAPSGSTSLATRRSSNHRRPGDVEAGIPLVPH